MGINKAIEEYRDAKRAMESIVNRHIAEAVAEIVKELASAASNQIVCGKYGGPAGMRISDVEAEMALCDMVGQHCSSSLEAENGAATVDVPMESASEGGWFGE